MPCLRTCYKVAQGRLLGEAAHGEVLSLWPSTLKSLEEVLRKAACLRESCRDWCLLSIAECWRSCQTLEKPCVLGELAPAEAAGVARSWLQKPGELWKPTLESGLETREAPSSFRVLLLPLVTKHNIVPADKGEIMTRSAFSMADQAMRGESETVNLELAR